MAVRLRVKLEPNISMMFGMALNWQTMVLSLYCKCLSDNQCIGLCFKNKRVIDKVTVRDS